MPAALGGQGPCAERDHAGLRAGQAHIGCLDPLSAASVLVNIRNNTDLVNATQHFGSVPSAEASTPTYVYLPPRGLQ